MIPSELVVYTGQQISLTCYSSKSPTWLKDDCPLPLRFLRNKSRSIRIEQASAKHSGVYYCHGRDLEGVPFISQSEVYVGGKLFPRIFYKFVCIELCVIKI